MKGISLPVRLRLRLEDLDAAVAAALGELVAEAALADARLGDDADHGALAGARPSPAPASSAAISSSRPTKREKPRSRERSSRERAAPTPASSKTRDRPARALDLELAQVLELEEAVRQLGRGLGQVGLAGLGQRLHALREPDRVADRRVAALAARRSRRRRPRPS